ncbi:MAG: polyphosphate kinase 1 [Lentisphaerae bacterium]|nr:polyphosphate kinase 1 [Lentisphaerota bacterium]
MSNIFTPEKYYHETSRFFSRELSWLDFNSRVLDEAANCDLPLLDRLKFIAIFSSNLDEFFMVRIARLRHFAQQDDLQCDPAGFTAAEQLKLLRIKLEKLLKQQHSLLYDTLLPELALQGIKLLSFDQLSLADQQLLKKRFRRQILPVLTPLAVDPSHPFPVLNNCVIELAVHLQKLSGNQQECFAFVEVPEVLDRFIALPVNGQEQRFVLLEELIQSELPELFPGCRILDSAPIRITRDMDFVIEEDGDDLLRSVEINLLERRSREPIRLEEDSRIRGTLRNWLEKEFELAGDFRYRIKGMLKNKDLLTLIARCKRPDLQEKPLPPVQHPQLPEHENIFQSITQHGEILLAVPFHKFDPIIRLLATAAEDPSVLAIKQTLYRVSGDSPVVAMLAKAAANGKQVTVVVELKARFDEGNNILWARKLEEAGAHVVYGISGLKIHGKALLVVRRENDQIKRYVHLATGNYNDKTARGYTDLSIFSNDEALCEDISALFNIITGCARPEVNFQKISAAPFDLRWKLQELIEREIAVSTPERPGHIIAKMNSLSDPEIIRLFCHAADSGVKLDLIVRGICCLRPLEKTPNINIISIVDRFLEHSRIYYFANAGNEEFYLSSADCMTRNLDRRIEILFPVTANQNQQTLKRLLAFELNDQYKGRTLTANGSYKRKRNASSQSRSQHNIYQMFAAESQRSSENILKIFASFTSGGNASSGDRLPPDGKSPDPASPPASN